VPQPIITESILTYRFGLKVISTVP